MNALEAISAIRQAGGRVVVEDGDLRIKAPAGAIFAEAVAVIRENKAALIGILPDAEREAVQWVENLDQAEAEIVVDQAIREWDNLTGGDGMAYREVEANDPPADPSACVCGCKAWRDVPIHGGKSIRRDCAKCRRFISFPVWHGKAEESEKREVSQ